MLMCKGNGCNWKRQCSRYVLGRDVAPNTDISARMLDHCPHRQDKFVAVNSEEGRQAARMLGKGKEAGI